jgi:hypothetical protein
VSDTAKSDMPTPVAPPAKPAVGVAWLWKTRWFGVGFIVLLLALWELAAASGWVPSMSSAHERGAGHLVGAYRLG